MGRQYLRQCQHRWHFGRSDDCEKYHFSIEAKRQYSHSRIIRSKRNAVHEHLSMDDVPRSTQTRLDGVTEDIKLVESKYVPFLVPDNSHVEFIGDTRASMPPIQTPRCPPHSSLDPIPTDRYRLNAPQDAGLADHSPRLARLSHEGLYRRPKISARTFARTTDRLSNGPRKSVNRHRRRDKHRISKVGVVLALREVAMGARWHRHELHGVVGL